MSATAIKQDVSGHRMVNHQKRRYRASSLGLLNHSLIDLLDDPLDNINTPPLLLLQTEPLSNTSRRHSSSSFLMTDVDDFEQNKAPHKLNLAPPPVPKRTFQGKIFQKDFDTPIAMPSPPASAPANSNTYSKIRAELAKFNNPENRASKRPVKSINLTPNNNSLCSMSFDDIGDSDDLVVFDKKFLPVDSNQSSSDSNRSQTTIDTGYISSFDNDRSSIFTTADISNSQRKFRARFSSEETQSSDDYMSSDLQRTDTVDSLQSNFTDSPFSFKKSSNVFNFDPSRLNKKISSSGSIDSDNRIYTTSNKNQLRRPPAVPARNKLSSNRPPNPPARALEPGKLLSQNVSAFNATNDRQIKNDSIQELQNRPILNNMSKKGINRPPPLTQIHHSKMNQRQDSSISSDSCSVMSSPGYNSKNMEIPLLQNASKINRSRGMQHQSSNDSFNMPNMKNFQNVQAKVNIRQDSNISSDSFSQTSSPGYNTKLIEAPLLAHVVKKHAFKQIYKKSEEITKENTQENNCNAAITKSVSTPASLQTIVRLSNGSNMSLQHKILRARKNSNPYITRGRLKFRLCQVLLNALALLLIAGGLAAYFNAYPTIKFVNKTIITPAVPERPPPVILTPLTDLSSNPAPGVCLPVIVKFCLNNKIPYNYTVFPNYIGHFRQLEAQTELDLFDALVDVQCYELVPLFLCSLFVPKCSSVGKPVAPCKILCQETMRRCGFFLEVFGLELPEYLSCKLFSDSNNSDECIGMKEVREVKNRKPVCNGFSCDRNRCIPMDFVHDGYTDCFDQTDEMGSDNCTGPGTIHCGEQKCMTDKHICDGVVNCPYGQDERNCVRLSERNGDLGKGTLEVYKADKHIWMPACIKNWGMTTPTEICSMLGYSSVNSSKMLNTTNNTILPPHNRDTSRNQRQNQNKKTNWLKEFTSCNEKQTATVVELTCANYECGKVRNRNKRKPQTRIIGGTQAKPGDWPFIAAVLGGPEEVFYCAGVLIADQWVLTASHCIGNHTLNYNLNDWTIQLGMTRRHSHSYYGIKVKVKKVIPHPHYDFAVTHDNDIALFQLATRVAFHEHLLPVCLPPSTMNELEPGLNCTVIGWGKREDKTAHPNSQNTPYEPAVNQVQVPVLNRDLCNEWLDMLNVTEGMICAGYEEGGRDACQGDSGGPLVCPYPGEKDRWFVGGIVSWGIMCAHPKLPGVYANVPKYIPWIMQQIFLYSGNKSDLG